MNDKIISNSMEKCPMINPSMSQFQIVSSLYSTHYSEYLLVSYAQNVTQFTLRKISKSAVVTNDITNKILREREIVRDNMLLADTIPIVIAGFQDEK